MVLPEVGVGEPVAAGPGVDAEMRVEGILELKEVVLFILNILCLIIEQEKP